MISQREEEYEKGILLLKEQRKSPPKDALSFAGIEVKEEELEEIENMSLKEYLVHRDLQVFRFNNGIEEEEKKVDSKKRKFNEISKETEEDKHDGNPSKRKHLNKVQTSAWLDTGSVSWSMLIAIYVLALHDDRKSFFITLDSIKEMLDVLKNEFNEFVPFENDRKLLDLYVAGDLQKLKDSSYIDVINLDSVDEST